MDSFRRSGGRMSGIRDTRYFGLERCSDVHPVSFGRGETASVCTYFTESNLLYILKSQEYIVNTHINLTILPVLFARND